MSERTHEPTPQRRQRALREGHVPTSRVCVAAASTAGGLVGLLATAEASSAALRRCAVASLSLAHLDALAALERAARAWIQASSGALLGATGGALVGALALVGLRFRLEPLLPKLQRLGALAGARALPSLRALGDLARAGLVAGVVLVVTAATLWDGAFGAAALVDLPPDAALEAALALVAAAVARGALAFALLGVADLGLAHLRHRRELRMSLEEVRREHRESEGDPATKARRQAVHRQLVLGGPARGVARATTVVVNPTHIAVALRYDERECDAPYLVAKGTAAAALALRARAFELGIPVVKDVPLARALVQAEVGECIPEELYVAAAAVLRVALDAEGAVDASAPLCPSTAAEPPP